MHTAQIQMPCMGLWRVEQAMQMLMVPSCLASCHSHHCLHEYCFH